LAPFAGSYQVMHHYPRQPFDGRCAGAKTERPFAMWEARASRVHQIE
jgi:hypothetical protein